MSSTLRSQKRADDRTRRFAKLLSPEKMAQFQHEIPALKQEQPSPWKGGIEPPPFDEFCVMLDGQSMFDRQVDAWDTPRLLRANDLFNVDRLRSIVEWILIWGKGCLVGHTLLTDHATGRTRTMAEWAEEGSPLILKTWDGQAVREALACPVYRKGREALVRVRLADGRVIEGSSQHRCLTPQGWSLLGRLRAGDMLLTLPQFSNPRTPGSTHDRTGRAVSSPHEKLATWTPEADRDPQASVRASETPDPICCPSPRNTGLPHYTRITGVTMTEEQDYYDLCVPKTACYFDDQGVLHHNSGKDYLSSKFISYIAYCLCSLAEDPAAYMARRAKLDLAPSTRIDCVNVAPNEDLARGIYFDYLKKWMNHALFAPFLKTIGADRVQFHNVPLRLLSLHSRSSGLDGYNLLCWVMDEADAFFDNAKKSNADEIHRIFTSSSESRFGPFAIGMVISYPRLEAGFLLRLEEHARKHRDVYYVDKAGTKEVRPNFNADSPRVREEYERDPRAARALYECIPMATADAFIEYPEKIVEAVDPTRQPIAQHYEIEVERPLRNGAVAKYVSLLLENIRYQPGYAYFVSADGGLKGDRFAIGVGHVDETGNAPEWICPRCMSRPDVRALASYEKLIQNVVNDEAVRCGICMQRPWDISPMSGRRGWWRRVGQQAEPLMVNGKAFAIPPLFEDLILYVTPRQATRPGEQDVLIDLPGMQEILCQLINVLHPKQVRMDPWNTAQMIQDLRSRTGADVDEILFSAPEQFRRARLLKALLYANLLTLIPNALRDREWRRLQRTNTKIDHPDGPGESKDIYDAEAIWIWLAATYYNKELELIW